LAAAFVERSIARRADLRSSPRSDLERLPSGVPLAFRWQKGCTLETRQNFSAEVVSDHPMARRREEPIAQYADERGET
jgi:D-aminopeptidase